MKLAQAHYTSCRHGTSGQEGFQIRACSPGLAGAVAQVSSAANYQAPLILPISPSAQEIEALFPVRFRYEPTVDGGWLLCRSVYLGLDFTRRRWGNYFGHVVTTPRPLSQRWPIDLVAWDGWRSGYAPEEDTAPPPPLAEIHEGALPTSDPTPPAWLAAFLGESPERVGLLATIIDALRQRAERGRPVLVRAEPPHGIAWAAAATRVFPLHLATSISLSTFQWGPRGALHLNVTTDGTELELTDHLRRHQFQVIDTLQRDRDTAPASRFASWSAGALAADRSRIARFHSFLDWAARSPVVDAELEPALDCFLLVEGGEDGPEALGDAVRWGAERLREEGLLALGTRLAAALTSLPEPAPGWLLAFVSRLLAPLPSPPAALELAAEIFVSRLPAALVASDLATFMDWRRSLTEGRPELATAINLRLATAFAENRASWPSRVAGPREATALLDLAADVAAPSGVALLEALVDEGLDGPQGDAVLAWWVKRSLAGPGRASALVAWMAERPDRFGPNGPTTSPLAPLVAAVLPPEEAGGLCRSLHEAGLEEAAAAIGVSVLAAAPMPDAAWRAWARGAGTCAASAREALLERLPRASRAAVALAWVVDGDEARCEDPELAARMLELANDALTAPAPVDTLAAVRDAAARRCVRLRPDRPALALALTAPDAGAALALVDAAQELADAEREGWIDGLLAAFGPPVEATQVERASALATLEGFAPRYAAAAGRAGLVEPALIAWLGRPADLPGRERVLLALREQIASWSGERRRRLVERVRAIGPAEGAFVAPLEPAPGLFDRVGAWMRTRLGGGDGGE